MSTIASGLVRRSTASFAAAVALTLICAATACSSKSIFPGRDAGTSPSLKGDGGALQVQIKGSPNNCPAVAFTVAPPDAKVDEDLDVNATAADPDPTDQLTFAWTASAGLFGSSKVAHTAYTCSVAGPQMITLSVSDGQCTVTRTASVYCYATGVVVGSGGAAGGGGISGRGGAGGGANGTGGSTGAGTGGGPGTGTGGVGTGTGGAGTGTGGAGMSECMGSLTTQATHGEGELCEQCTSVACSTTTDGCDDGLNSDADIQLCRRLYCCIRVNKCSYAGDSIKCWCGGTETAYPCSAYNGPCLNEIEAAAKSKDPATIEMRLPDPTYPVGRAINLAACRGAFCGRVIPNVTDPQDFANACMIQ